MPNIRDILTAKKFSDTRRLAATYLAIIMGLTLVFSSVIYTISASQFDRPLGRPGQQNVSMLYQYDIQELLEQRAREARSELIASLVFLNVTVFVGGVLLSYALARKTLQPIEDAMEAQSRFVSDASHELRTPLTALQVTNEVALRKKKLSLTEAKELIEYNLSETIKLRNLSQALLGVAVQNEGQGVGSVQQEQFSAQDSVRLVAESFMSLMKTKSITFVPSSLDVQVTANKQAYENIIRILLDNAVKYSPNGATVSVTIERRNNQVITTISDTGPGIAKEHQTKIFDRFYRVDESRSSQNIEGSGLGLSIAKSIASQYGFGLSVRSAAAKGSDFSLSISL